MKIGFFGLLTVVFVALKLTGVIAWSWWLVLLPLWIPTGILVCVAMVIGVVGVYLLVSKQY